MYDLCIIQHVAKLCCQDYNFKYNTSDLVHELIYEITISNESCISLPNFTIMSVILASQLALTLTGHRSCIACRVLNNAKLKTYYRPDLI